MKTNTGKGKGKMQGDQGKGKGKMKADTGKGKGEAPENRKRRSSEEGGAAVKKQRGGGFRHSQEKRPLLETAQSQRGDRGRGEGDVVPNYHYSCRTHTRGHGALAFEPAPGSAPLKYTWYFSCSRTTTASDGPSGGHSPLRQALLDEVGASGQQGVGASGRVRVSCQKRCVDNESVGDYD